MIKEITLTKDEYDKYCKFAFARLTPAKKNEFKQFIYKSAFWLVLVAAFSILFLFIKFYSSKFHWLTALVTSIPFLIFIITFIGNLKKIEKKSAPKEDGLILGRKTIEIDDSGIKETNSLGMSIYKWEALQEVVVHEGSVYLFLDTMLAQVIPCSAFKGKDEANEFAAHVEKLHNRFLQPIAIVSDE